MGRHCRTLCFDVADRASVRGSHQSRHRRHTARITARYATPASCSDNAFPAMTGEEWDRVMHTNLDGFYNVLHPLVMPMVRRRKPGRIVTIASVSGLIGNRGQTNYSAAKGRHHRRNEVVGARTRKTRNYRQLCGAGLDRHRYGQRVAAGTIKSLIPARRLGTPDEVAAAVAFLFSADAGYITRQVISVNGGLA